MTRMAQRVKILRVIDGDTLEVETGGGLMQKSQRTRIRMYGIDAPESSQKGGPESTRHLERLIGSHRNAWMNASATDQYGRTVGLVYPKRGKPQNSYNFRMVRDGQAWVYMAGAADRSRYEEAEAQAKAKRRGIWKNQKSQQAPWAYRRRRKHAGSPVRNSSSSWPWRPSPQPRPSTAGSGGGQPSGKQPRG